MSARPSVDYLKEQALILLKKLIQTPSISREEAATADLIGEFFRDHSIVAQRSGNNVWAINQEFDERKPTLLLNSHHDTVKPNAGYTKDPFQSIVENGRLYGLGSNDAGGCLTALLATFVYFYDQVIPYNIVMAATAEEEISGTGGIASILAQLPLPECAIVGEPTEMKMSVAEKGLMVLDCEAHGVSGHAARSEGVNAIYEAAKDIAWFRSFLFEKESQFLGPIHMAVTQIEAGSQHNVVPDRCKFVVDVRTTDAYSNQEVVAIVRAHVSSTVMPRSTRLNPSYLPEDMALHQVGRAMGIEQYGSPTLSDQALMHFPSCKMGPGRSERSHTADEYIYLEEIEQGVDGYIHLLERLFTNKIEST